MKQSRPRNNKPTVKVDQRVRLREAVEHAIDGERRFGIREDARPELSARWDRVITLIEALCG